MVRGGAKRKHKSEPKQRHASCNFLFEALAADCLTQPFVATLSPDNGYAEN